MNIIKTYDDGSVRAAAILHTQNALRLPLGTRPADADAQDELGLTLVQTSAGVRTLRAIVASLRAHEDAEVRLSRLVEEAEGEGMRSVAEGLRITWRRERHLHDA